ncbi:hypothetical protein HDV05_001765 [Chytridiales sp. JEL 0842]|nr:hypothetical protein HDV05_001765 [Chytridiales sp. JEL 0842]
MRVSYGVSTDIGRRSSQQDDYLIQHDVFGDSPKATLFAVFDGHGSEGGKASRYVKTIFPEVLHSLRSQFTRDVTSCLKEAYATVNTMLSENSAIDTYMSGTTAALLIVLEDEGRAVIANVGDSRVLLGKYSEGGGGKLVGVQITTDHTCNNPQELDRVKSMGARIEQLQIGEAKDGPLRIFKGTLPYPGLVVTRSLGDAVAGRLGVLCEPEVIDIKVSGSDRFFVLATDGLWDGLDIADVVKIVGKHTDPTKVSEKLTQKALAGMDAKQIDDNITNIFVMLE